MPTKTFPNTLHCFCDFEKKHNKDHWKVNETALQSAE